ncbi:MAG: hypothetical protein ACXW2Y_08450 [Acidimicrobiia bacterium]
MRRFLVLPLVVLAALLAVAGCSSSNSKPSSTDSGGSGATSGATGCDLVTPADIAATLGLTVGSAEVTDNDPVTVCTYPPTGGSTSQVILRFQTGFTKDDVATSRAQFEDTQQPTADVTGIGEVAFSSSIGSGSVQTNTLETLQGDTDLLITAGAPLAGIETLAKQVLQQL